MDTEDKKPLVGSKITPTYQTEEKEDRREEKRTGTMQVVSHLAERLHTSRQFVVYAISMQIILIIFYALACDYQDALPTDEEDTARSDYVQFQQINVMMFVGFGFLMTFLRRYGYSAVALNMLLSALCVQWGMFMQGLSDVLFTHKTHTLTVSVDGLAQGDIAAAAVLISMGALLGRTTPLQLLIMAILEIILYAVNLYIVTEILYVNDVGGSITVHTFGAYFGLGVSIVLGKPYNEHHDTSEYHSDLFSMIGTIFLWLYWPSFNGIFPGDLPFSETRCFTNTVLSLSSCVVATFAFSMFFGRGFDMVHIQNATLAGGVAVGAAANLYLTPAGAMAVGLIAGFLSVIGFTFISPFLQRKIGLYDTCGVHNLHGLPGILGAVVSAIAIGAATTSHYSDGAFHRDFGGQAGFQIIGLVVTLGIAICGGGVVGWLLRYTGFVQPRLPFMDKEFFQTPDPFHLIEGFGEDTKFEEV